MNTAAGKTIRIGGASGFWGDSAVGAPQLVARVQPLRVREELTEFVPLNRVGKRVTGVGPSSIVQSTAPSTVETCKRRSSSQSSAIGPTSTRSTEAPK